MEKKRQFTHHLMFSKIRQKKSFKGSLGLHPPFAKVRGLPEDTQWSHTRNSLLSPPGRGAAHSMVLPLVEKLLCKLAQKESSKHLIHISRWPLETDNICLFDVSALSAFSKSKCVLSKPDHPADNNGKNEKTSKLAHLIASLAWLLTSLLFTDDD